MSTKLPAVKLPTVAELFEDKAVMKKQNELNILLNTSPKEEWVKSHPFVKNLRYLPIERVEYLLTVIFSKWWVEVKEVKVLANSIVVTVRLWVTDPVTGEDMFQDGIGATPIQVQKGNGALAFDHMNPAAIQIGAPSAESYAIKDAAEKFGKLFGKDLNRKDTISYIDRIQSNIDAVSKLSLIEQIEKITDKTELRKLWLEFTQKERDDNDIKNAYESKDESLR